MINPFSSLRQVIYDAPCNGRLAAVARYIPIVSAIFFNVKSKQYWDLYHQARVGIAEGPSPHDINMTGVEHLRNIVVLEVYMCKEQEKVYYVMIALLILKAFANRSISFAVLSVVGYSIFTFFHNTFCLSSWHARLTISPGSVPGPNYAYEEAYRTLGWPIPEQYTWDYLNRFDRH